MLPRDKTKTPTIKQHGTKLAVQGRVASARAGVTVKAPATRLTKPSQHPDKDNGRQRQRPAKHNAAPAAPAKNNSKMKHLIVLLFGSVCRWDQRLRPKLRVLPSPKLRLTYFAERKLIHYNVLVTRWHWSRHRHIFLFSFWIREKSEVIFCETWSRTD